VVTVLVVNSVGRHPEDRSALERHGGADGHDVLDPLWRVITAMGEEAVIAHSDADIDGENVEDRHNRQPLPAEEEERRKGASVEDDDGSESDPVETLSYRSGTAQMDEIAGGHIMSIRRRSFVRSRNVFG